jgi:asparagine synthase (glutamine-hydrolysing)
MCGITAIIDFQQRSTPDMLQRMTTALAHRGPDGEGHTFEVTLTAQVGLGHRRLSIIDLSDAALQPMDDANNRWRIVFNGEIYNYQAIKAELKALGHRFHTQSDTEVILLAFEQWGARGVDRFIGMFAFALHDRVRQEMWFFRDRGGAKPLYYYHREGLWLFGSELKALHQHPRFEAQMDTSVLPGYLQTGYIAAPRTIFQHTAQLLPGHSLHLDLKTGRHTLHCYWNALTFYQKPKLHIDEAAASLELERLLQSACQYRMVADVPVGIFLSGGYDSSLVTALLAADQTAQLRTFSIGFDVAAFNEAPYAEAVAAHLGTQHETCYCTMQEALGIVPTLPHYYDEPMADAAAIPTILLSRHTRRAVKVALSADAGDELLAGYTKYEQILRFRRYTAGLPQAVKSTLAYLMQVPAPLLQHLPVRWSKIAVQYAKIIRLLRAADPNAAMLATEQAFTDAELRQLLLLSAPPNLPSLQDLEKLQMSDDWLDAMLCFDYQVYMPGDLLAKVDRATMSAGLEGREPLLDHRLLEFSAQLPSDLKYRAGQKKYLLKKIAHQYIPPTLLDRPKMGFSVPMAQWMQTDLKPLCHEYLSKQRIEAGGLFHYPAVRAIQQKAEAGRAGFALKLWHLLVFELWRQSINN